MNFEVWAYRALIGAFGMIIWYIIRQWTIKIPQKLDTLIEVMKDLSIKIETQKGEVKLLSKLLATQEQRINDHSERIRDVEIKQNR